MLRATHRWILRHDDSPLFVALYVGLAVVLSIWLGLFWLLAVVFIHFLFELVKQHQFDSRPAGVLSRALWEIKLDIGLIFFAFVITLYMEMVMGVVGLSAAARSGAQAAARFGLWQSVLRSVLLSLDDAAQVARALAARRRKGAAAGASEEEEEAGAPTPPFGPPEGGPELWGGWVSARWSWGDRFSLGFGVLCLGMVFAAPQFTAHTLESAFAFLASELHPLAELQ